MWNGNINSSVPYWTTFFELSQFLLLLIWLKQDWTGWTYGRLVKERNAYKTLIGTQEGRKIIKKATHKVENGGDIVLDLGFHGDDYEKCRLFGI
jgi:hypothetical protein